MKRSLSIIAVFLSIFFIVVFTRGWRDQAEQSVVLPPDVGAKSQSASVNKAPKLSLAESLGLTEDDMTDVGGVKRPKRDIQAKQSVDLLKERERYLSSLPAAGETRDVLASTNEKVALLHSELKGDEDAMSARSVLFSDGEFDRDEYLSDSEAYLRKTRPSRAIEAMEPGPNVVPIEAVGSLYRELVQGESAVLEVKAEPGMPVTFHAQLGEFENQLKTISVASSEDGVAKVAFKAVSGVLGNIRLSAASPVHSGRLSYVIKVVTKD